MKSFWLKTSSAAALAICAVAGVSHADDTASSNTTNTTATTPVAGTSTAEATVAKTPAPAIPFSISDYSMMVGPALKSPTTDTSADSAIGALQPMSSRQYVSFFYQINDHMTVGPVADFTYNFNSVPGAYNQGVTWNDQFVSFRDNGFITTKIGNNDFKANLWVNYLAPTSHVTNHNGGAGEMSVWLNPSLQFHDSHWSLSGYSFIEYYGNFDRTTDIDSNSPLPRWRAYAGPQVNYQVSDAVTVFVLYEANMHLYTNGVTDHGINPAASMTDVEPGVMWSVSKKVTLFPYLNWYLNQNIDTTALGLNASFKFL